MSLQTVKRMASRLLKAGESRIRIKDAARAAGALTSDDVRELVKAGVVVKTPVTGTGRGKARIRASRKQAGRGRGEGSRRGTPNAVLSRKSRWIRRVRGLRRVLAALRSRLKEGAHKKLYGMVKGAAIRDKRQLHQYIKNNALMREVESK